MTPEITAAVDAATKLLELDAKATPGPWHVLDGSMEGFDGEWDVCGPDLCGIASISGTGSAAKFERNKEENAFFIAAARNDAPALARAVLSLSAEVERLNKILEAKNE
jgi:hypothetical protein